MRLWIERLLCEYGFHKHYDHYLGREFALCVRDARTQCRHLRWWADLHRWYAADGTYHEGDREPRP